MKKEKETWEKFSLAISECDKHMQRSILDLLAHIRKSENKYLLLRKAENIIWDELDPHVEAGEMDQGTKIFEEEANSQFIEVQEQLKEKEQTK